MFKKGVVYGLQFSYAESEAKGFGSHENLTRGRLTQS